MNILAIRHTSVNAPSGVCYGHQDVGVSDKFDEEADAVRKLLPDDVGMYKAISSPSSRCTALASRLGLTFSTDSRLMELNFGVWEGKTWNSIHETKEGKEWFRDYENTICPEGESFSQLRDRVEELINHYVKEGTEQLLIVAHGGTLRSLFLICGICETAQEAFAKDVPYGGVFYLTYPA